MPGGSKARPCVLRVMGSAGEYRPRRESWGYVGEDVTRGWYIAPLKYARIFTDRTALWHWWRTQKSLHVYATAPDDLAEARAAQATQETGR